MKQGFLKIGLLAILMSNVAVRSWAQKKSAQLPAMRWELLSSLPDRDGRPNLGVAGAFSGISRGALLLAGGANFPGIPSWKNGPKKYWSSVYVLPLERSRPLRWLDTLFRFPYPVAYGASLTLDEGILCIGGKNNSGYLSKVLLLQWNNTGKRIAVKPYPDLPVPLASMAAARIGHTIYVAGGENETGKQDALYALDLEKLSSGWKTLPPLPGGPLSDAVLVSQSGGDHEQLYLIGGRTTAQDGATVFYHRVYVFDPLTATWGKRHEITNDLHQPVGLAAGTGSAVGDRYIALFGGDDGILFNELAAYKKQASTAADAAQRAYWQERFDSLSVHHPGFNKTVFLYNTITDTWKVMDSLPFPAQVTTNIISYKERIILPSGEVRPGIRTPQLWELKTGHE